MTKNTQSNSQCKKPIDRTGLARFAFIHTIIHIYRILTDGTTKNKFSPPRFKLFKSLHNTYGKHDGVSLLKTIALTFRNEVLVGAIITVLYASLNLTIPELVKMFMEFMHQKNPEQEEVKSSFQFLKLFIVIQILRIFIGQHSKRLFYELAIKVQSALAKKLIQKSLKLSKKVRQRTAKSSILQLQNVDLKLIFNLIQMSHLFFETPFTLIIATLMLFNESKIYGVIGIYWFIIVFLIQLQLDGKMTHCNATKLKLIEKRSQVNYELLQHINQAKIIGWQDCFVQANNDFFIQENQDHKQFYFYGSLYDISILMLPVLVVVTICVYDVNSTHPITVQQVYLILSLLNICYQPMKNFRGLLIALHDGLHSMNRIQNYFDLSEENKIQNRKKDEERLPKGTLVVQKGTSVEYELEYNLQTYHLHQTFYKERVFKLTIPVQIQVNPGQRLLLLGRKFQGRSTFISMILGTIAKISGGVLYNGSFSYTPEQQFFTKQSVRDNIIFFDDSIDQNVIQRLAEKLNIKKDLKNRDGLDTIIDNPNSFSRSARGKISVARALARDADFYVLDRPFEFLDYETCKTIQSLLRQKQKQGKTVIIAPSQLSYIQEQDLIAIIDDGSVKQFGSFKDLKNNQRSMVGFFYKSQSQKVVLAEHSPMELLIQNKMKSKDGQESQQISVIQLFRSFHNAEQGSIFDEEMSNILKQQESTQLTKNTMLESYFHHSNSVVTNQRNLFFERNKQKFRTHLKHFITCVPFSQTFFILLIILCAQLLHIFIHFFIGHLEQQHDAYLNYMHMVGIQVILTIGLALVLYYEGQISSRIAVMQGNILYKQSLQSLVRKRFKWFNEQYKTYIADKFNHDYEEVFIACHGFLGIYKNLIILLTTIEFISSDSWSFLLAFLFIGFLFVSIFMVFRTMEKKITKEYYNYKYKYVKVLEESIEGVQLFKVYQNHNQLLKRAQHQYKKLASYKLANSYTMHGLSIACDVASVMLLSAAVSYGLDLKMHSYRTNLAIIATSIHLLMNASQVLKSLVKDTIGFQTFFAVNLVPFMEIRDQEANQVIKKVKHVKCSPQWNLQFDFIRLRDIGQMTEMNSLIMNIPQGQKILIYQTDARARSLLLQALTSNLPMMNQPQFFDKYGSIRVGQVDIKHLDVQYLRNRVAVIMNKNFFMTGSIRQNLYRKAIGMEDLAYKYIKIVKLNKDIPQFKKKGLDAKIQFELGKVNHQITKKFALVRILLSRPRIVIIKDTPAFIGSLSIIEILEKYVPGCTIIKISGKLQASSNTDRIVYMQSHKIIEDVRNINGKFDQRSKVGQMLKTINIQGYLFMNKGSDRILTSGKSM